MVQTWTHGTDIDSWYRQGLMVLTLTHGIDMDSWYRHRLMVQTWTQGIDSDLWYSFSTPLSHMNVYERAGCCPYAGFF